MLCFICSTDIIIKKGNLVKMYEVITKVSFEAAHRLYSVNTFSSECRDNIHGHSYVATIAVDRSELNEAGMVIDFKKLKTVIKNKIENTYDHSCILNERDPLVEPMKKQCKKLIVTDENPTAEWMCNKFFEELLFELVKIDENLNIRYVSVQETENNIATYINETAQRRTIE